MPNFSRPPRPLRWRTQAPLRGHLPPALKPWLLDSGSLTAKLVALSGGDFQVQVLRQVHERASLSEQQALGIARRQLCLIREVVLQGQGQPWVFARSVLPLSSLNGQLRHLRKQGSRPLGAFLFTQPQLQRSAIALSLINSHHGYVPKNLLGKQSAWGRRSIFSIAQQPLLVSEVFLPDFPDSHNSLSTTKAIAYDQR